MQMIFDTQGTGFYKNAVREMMEQPVITFLSGLDGDGSLGDEIMLLSGIDDLAENHPHGFDDGPARTWTMPSSDRGTMYQFPHGPAELGSGGNRLGGVIGDLADWPRERPRMARPDFKYQGLGRSLGPQYRYQGLDDWPSRMTPLKYKYSGLGAVGDTNLNAYRIGAVIALGAAYWLSR